MSRENIVLVTNIYKITNVDELFDMPFTSFRVLAGIKSEGIHGLAKQIAGNIRRKFKVFAFNHVSKRGDYVYVVGDVDAKEVEYNERGKIWSIVKETEGYVGNLSPSTITRLLYELFNNVLIFTYGYYKVRKSYYIHTKYKILNGNITRYRLYEGFYIKILKGKDHDEFYIAIDPTRTLTYDTPLIKYIKQGIIDRWKDRGMFAIYTRASDGIEVIRYGVVKKIDLNTSISRHKVPTPIHAIDKCGHYVSLKDYYICVVNALESAYMDNDEPVVLLDEYSYPPSILYPVVKTEDIKAETKEIKQIYFLDPKERLLNTNRIRDLIATVKVLNIPEIKLAKEPLSCNLNNIPYPKLLVGNNKEIELDPSNSVSYKQSLLDNLRLYGPYSKVGMRTGDILFLFKKRQGVSGEMLIKLYKDLRKTAKKDFKTVLPAKPKVKELDRITEEVLRMREKDILLIFVMLSNKNDEDYYRLKRIFNKFDIPSQMITPEILDYLYTADPKKRKRYVNIRRNLVIGALGKAGVVPWILKDELYADLYIGYDIGHGPTHEHPCIASFTFFDKYGRYISTCYVNLGNQRKLSNSSKIFNNIENCFNTAIEKLKKLNKANISSAIIHKDGDIYNDDILVFKGIADKLKIKIALVSVKKRKGYRLYRMSSSSNIRGSLSGDYFILNNEKALIITMGHDFIKQGTPQPLLIELNYVEPEFDYSLEKALEDIYKLSFIHWQVITSKIKLPATIAYADEWAYLGIYDVEPTDTPPL